LDSVILMVFCWESVILMVFHLGISHFDAYLLWTQSF
jgi:hypothetical protein